MKKDNNLYHLTFKGDNAPFSTRFTYSFVSTFRDALLQFVSLFLLLYVQFASPLGLEDLTNYQNMYLMITIGLVIIKVLSGLISPFTSYFIEKRTIKFGKFRFFTLLGAILSSIFYFLMFTPIGKGYTYVSLFLLFVLFQELLYQFNDIAFWGYLPTIAKENKVRIKTLSIMNTFIAIGSYTICALSPLLTTGDAKNNLTITAIIIGLLYLISQIIFSIFFMREREDNITLKDNEDKKKDSYLKNYAILFKDKQILIAMISFFLVFVSQFVVIGNSVNYFYYNYGYGSFDSLPLNNALLSGGALSFLFSILYGIGSTLGIFLFPYINKLLSKKKILIIAAIFLTLGYLYLFFFGLNIGQEIGFFIVSFITFFFQGLTYIIFTNNCTNLAEYHEHFFKEKKELTIASFKFLSVKTANGLQTLLLYLFLALSSLFGVSNEISNVEASFNLGEITSQEKTQLIYQIITRNDLTNNLLIYRIGFTILPLILLLIAIIITIKFLKINDEKYYNEIKNQLIQK